ncbi:hypothetical protein DCAR_0206777 [Daucus carota subsp. sativus]|uniref:Uncharacterized protein n=1 Tax=Daucus carota subsp. sativus TaxID=79200 RepID=A0A166DF54_DAUCS|nr:hypothetical protein DCAR_0206777 [Daucus carota subsp. sativus]
MEYTAYKSKSSPHHRIPPKRGEVQRKVLSKLLKSAVTVVSLASRGSGGVSRRSGRSLSSSSSASDGTLSGYGSDDHLDA